jgi:hypothetical protein
MYFPGIGNSCLVSLQVVWKREAAVDLLLLLKASTSDQFCEERLEIAFRGLADYLNFRNLQKSFVPLATVPTCAF